MSRLHITKAAVLLSLLVSHTVYAQTTQVSTTKTTYQGAPQSLSQTTAKVTTDPYGGDIPTEANIQKVAVVSTARPLDALELADTSFYLRIPSVSLSFPVFGSSVAKASSSVPAGEYKWYGNLDTLAQHSFLNSTLASWGLKGAVLPKGVEVNTAEQDIVKELVRLSEALVVREGVSDATKIEYEKNVKEIKEEIKNNASTLSTAITNSEFNYDLSLTALNVGLGYASHPYQVKKLGFEAGIILGWRLDAIKITSKNTGSTNNSKFVKEALDSLIASRTVYKRHGFNFGLEFNGTYKLSKPAKIIFGGFVDGMYARSYTEGINESQDQFEPGTVFSCGLKLGMDYLPSTDSYSTGFVGAVLRYVPGFELKPKGAQHITLPGKVIFGVEVNATVNF